MIPDLAKISNYNLTRNAVNAASVFVSHAAHPYWTLQKAIACIEIYPFITIKCYHVFDPRSRNEVGMAVTQDGSSQYHRQAGNLCASILRLHSCTCAWHTQTALDIGPILAFVWLTILVMDRKLTLAQHWESKVGQGWANIGLKLAYDGRNIGQNVADDWHNIGLNLADIWRNIGLNLADDWRVGKTVLQPSFIQ